MKNKNTILSIIKLTMLYVLGFISLVTVSKFYVFFIDAFNKNGTGRPALINLNYDIIRLIIVLLFMYINMRIINNITLKKQHRVYVISGLILLLLVYMYNCLFYIIPSNIVVGLSTSRSIAYISVLQIMCGIFKKSCFSNTVSE